jgi:UDP-N-acetylmuramate dehydrogenase
MISLSLRENLRPPPFTGHLALAVAASEITHLRMGGPLSVVAWPRRPHDALRIFRWAARRGLPLVVLGGGSNVLVLEEGFSGVAVVTTRMLGVTRTLQGLSAMAGTPTASLSRHACRRGLAGLEFAAGLPGTIGGAVTMNARAYGGEMSDVVTAVLAAEADGSLIVFRRDDLEFAYKRTALQEHTTCGLCVFLRLARGRPSALLQRSRDILDARRRAGHFDHPSAGCFFRNPPAPLPPAGKLLDDAGMRGHKVGGAQLSPQHANVLVNRGNATPSDVLRLAALAAEAVEERTGVVLKSEVKVLGREGWIDPLLAP